MGAPEKMFDWDEEWNISFAGCGFRSIYYLGALSCILEKVPQLVHGASKICGASSGCLVAAALAVGIQIGNIVQGKFTHTQTVHAIVRAKSTGHIQFKDEFCADLLSTAKEARKHTLGVFHPTFSLLRTAKDFLLKKLPEDAHLRASGRLCVSLTRIADRENVLVSEFASREELIQVLMCSCFFPFYSGFSLPSYRGEYYMDGALSNNMPLFEQRNTITMAPFSGESDICPREGTFNFFESHIGYVCIQVNTGNVHRICTSFLPQKPTKLAEICNNGYVDALRFLRERDLLGPQNLPSSLEPVKPACCELVESRKTVLNGHKPYQEDHGWLDLKVVEKLPVGLKKVLCESCRDSQDSDSQATQFLPVTVFLYLLKLLVLPFELLFLIFKSIVFGCSLMMLTSNLHWQTKSSRVPLTQTSGFGQEETETSTFDLNHQPKLQR